MTKKIQHKSCDVMRVRNSATGCFDLPRALCSEHK